METPKKRNPEKTARDILDAASVEFSENGLEVRELMSLQIEQNRTNE
jgi:hypothetical protein